MYVVCNVDLNSSIIANKISLFLNVSNFDKNPPLIDCENHSNASVALEVVSTVLVYKGVLSPKQPGCRLL